MKPLQIRSGVMMLVTADDWFFAPDGHSYKAVWGECMARKAEDLTGVIPNDRSANWYMQIGDGENGILLAGCRIHYAVACSKRPVGGQSIYFPDRGRDQ